MDAVQEFLTSGWWKVILQIIGAAALAAAITPNKWDDIILKTLRAWLDILAMNIGNAANKEATK